jgi:CAAX protease family protein
VTSDSDDPAEPAHGNRSEHLGIRPDRTSDGSPDSIADAGSVFAFHQLARMSGALHWWRPLLGTGVVLGGVIAVILVVTLTGEAAAILVDRPKAPDGSRTWGDIGDTALLLLAIAALAPAVLVAARWVQRRPAGTVSSVAGRLRRHWLAVCLAAAFPLALGLVGFQLLRPGSGIDEAELVDPSSFLFGLAVVCLLVPLQAAGEEYFFRGWLMQAIGALGGSPWLCVVPQALLFAAVHGWGTPWGFVDLTVFGLVTGLLTIRTGGLEAAIALHVGTNVLALGVASAVVGGLASEETAADMDWLLMVIDICVVLAYAALVLWLARRRRLVAVKSLTAPVTAGI